MGILDGGECFTFGSNQFGQLGVDEDVIPRKVQKVTKLEGHKLIRVACGDAFTTVVSDGVYSKTFS